MHSFFVDVNLFKANKERAAGIAKSNNDIVGHVNNGSSTSTIDGLANEDANLMIKLKFLTYKLRTFLIRNGLSILFKDGPAAYRAYYLRDVFSSIQSETIIQKSCRAFSSGDVSITISKGSGQMQFGYGHVRRREKAEEALSAQMKLTAIWEIRARQKGWREKVAKSNAFPYFI
ncbi:hypothetical protein E1A91_A05G296900v1 [Gossypium mustelinum]|uniref:Uncharacterized protein n=2 Tax=Gossypium mustelinum TaxID=34275 RepID=A0A5D2ZE64_GOSMU|nr:hypothetical protein E1A91_A05G296900v1 [Gossypium mustelinum]